MSGTSNVSPSTKNIYVSVALIFVFTMMIVAALIFKPFALRASHEVVQSQDVSEITRIVPNRDKLEYLLLARPLSEFPRYVFKYKDSPQIHVVKVPSTSHGNIEREVLLKNNIPYAIAGEDGVFDDDDESSLPKKRVSHQTRK